MPKIANVERRGATYWWRRRVKLAVPNFDPKPLILAVSLRTKEPSVARHRAASLTAHSEELRMSFQQQVKTGRIATDDCQRIMQAEIRAYLSKIEGLHFGFQLTDLGEIDRNVRIGTDALRELFGAIARDGFTKDLAAGRAPKTQFPGVSREVRKVIAEALKSSPDLGNGMLDAGRELLDALGYAVTPHQLAEGRQLACRARVEAVQLFQDGWTVERLDAQPNDLAETVATSPPYKSQEPVENDDASSESVVCNEPEVAVATTEEVHGDAPGEEFSLSALSPSQAADEYMRAKPKTGGDPDLSRGEFKRKKSEAKIKVWGESARRQFRVAAYLLEKSMVGRPLASMQQSDLLALYDHFTRLPANHHKSPRHEAMTLEAICTDAKATATQPDVKPSIGLSVDTVNRHMFNLRLVCDWLAKKVPMAALDWTDVTFERPDHDTQNDRDGYSVEQGREIFHLPIWTGCLSLAHRLKAGIELWHDAAFFVMHILWYSGARREEVCKLLVDDFAELDGIKCFAIRETIAGSVKTAASVRLVPIAAELLRLGLWEYVEALRAAGETYVFPELRPGNDGQNQGDVFYKIVWQKIKPRLPFLKPGQAMHAQRHMVATELKLQGIPVAFWTDFIGLKAMQPGEKARSEEARRYAKVARLDVLLPVANAIPIVTAHLPDFATLNLLPSDERVPRPVRNSSGPRDRRVQILPSAVSRT